MYVVCCMVRNLNRHYLMDCILYVHCKQIHLGLSSSEMCTPELTGELQRGEKQHTNKEVTNFQGSSSSSSEETTQHG